MSTQDNDGSASGIAPNTSFGVWGDSGGGGNGVLGTSSTYTGIAGKTRSNRNDASGIYGEGPSVGVAGFTTGATAPPETSVGVYGNSSAGYGVLGTCEGYSFGVVGQAPNAGVAAFNPNNEHAAYLASDCCAAWFTGDVTITGRLHKGGGGFQIDHPLDPADKYLAHSFVESPDMKNIYDGIVVLDDGGQALVELPAWFEALNHDFRYQLTPIGIPAPDLHIAEEVIQNRFRIAGGIAGLRVSWQVTGARHDAWARANRIVVDEAKPVEERGHYLHPELHGAPKDLDIASIRHPRGTQKTP